MSQLPPTPGGQPPFPPTPPGVLYGTPGGGYGTPMPEQATSAAAVTGFVMRATGNVVAAQAVCDPSVTTAQLDQGADYLKSLGTLTNATSIGFNMNYNNGVKATEVTSVLSYGGGVAKTFTVTFGYKPDGTPVVTWWTVK